MRRLIHRLGLLAGAGLAMVATLWLLDGLPGARAADPAAKKIPAAEKKDDPGEKKGGATIDPMSVNANCYICHMTFVREQISKVHFKEKVTCVKCHGLSAAHANDEDIGATKPDIMYKRKEVDAMCAKCHEDHDVAAVEVIERFVERKPPNTPIVCTDCHGMHKIKASEEEEQELNATPRESEAALPASVSRSSNRSVLPRRSSMPES